MEAQTVNAINCVVQTHVVFLYKFHKHSKSVSILLLVWCAAGMTECASVGQRKMNAINCVVQILVVFLV